MHYNIIVKEILVQFSVTKNVLFKYSYVDTIHVIINISWLNLKFMSKNYLFSLNYITKPLKRVALNNVLKMKGNKLAQNLYYRLHSIPLLFIIIYQVWLCFAYRKL